MVILQQQINNISAMISYEFDKVKSINVILYIVERLQRRDFHKIFKILYFSDREMLAEFGRPITGDTYIAMHAGPVPSKIYDMLKIVRGDAYSKDVDGLGEYFRVYDWKYVMPMKKADVDEIAEVEKAILDSTLQQYGDMTYEEIKAKSHGDAWRNTKRDYPISFEDMAKEAGVTEDEMEYLVEVSENSKSCQYANA